VDHHVVTDAELEQARRDPAFRRQLIASSLEQLLGALARVRASESHSDPEPARQIREGVQLAMRLTDLLQRAGGRPNAA
jgi:hypothetical protein